ncbi:hypothetical protein MAA_11230 [Metarhizium robertsii ARSEF 23]|uniref:Uncharacterized protein n=1 Tax=Metarhizium robertsii (strain ARSEF 23 / ATCC MYA-3075) TaxID=655844 RepID=A0A0B2XI44_METRA|nr:uncharacterized protein MAA_11230 [Metarhizium robertsii ARSEF 23]KHO11152.1 hypothetical protein MAA_11230 [Metarhizium robertsii ARSEF 23]
MPDGHTDRIPGPHHGGNFEPPTRKRIQAHHAARPSLTRAVYTDRETPDIMSPVKAKLN